MNILKHFETELKEYCEKNEISYSKIESCPKCGNETILFVQRVDSSKASTGLNNEEPAEILLTLTKNSDGTITIEKGKNADKYLSV